MTINSFGGMGLFQFIALRSHSIVWGVGSGGESEQELKQGWNPETGTDTETMMNAAHRRAPMVCSA